MQAPEGLDSVQTALELVSVQSTEGTNVEDSVDSNAAAAEEQQLPEPDLDSKIVRQVNFYFSDTNLPTDNFLLKEVRKTPEGWGEPSLTCAALHNMSAHPTLVCTCSACQTDSQLQADEGSQQGPQSHCCSAGDLVRAGRQWTQSQTERAPGLG